MTPERLAWIRDRHAMWQRYTGNTSTIEMADLLPELFDHIDELTAERDLLKRGGKTLGEIVDRQCMAVIEATSSQDIIGEDGDGDWEIVWERLHLTRAALADMTRQRDDARRIAIDSGIFQNIGGTAYLPDVHLNEEDKWRADPVGAVAWDRQEQQP